MTHLTEPMRPIPDRGFSHVWLDDRIPPPTPGQRRDALHTLTRMDALDLAPMLGLTEDPSCITDHRSASTAPTA